MDMNDGIVIGAGAAGLSAGLTLARARRTTLLLDAGEPSNLAVPSIGGLLGYDRQPPPRFYAAARAELAAYSSAVLRSGKVTRAVREADGTFTVTSTDGRQEQARVLILAPGMDYRPPDLSGLAERWGTSVFHCPFCHGWENRDRPMGV